MEETKKQLKEIQECVEHFRKRYHHLMQGVMWDDFREIEARISLLKDEKGMYIMCED